MQPERQPLPTPAEIVAPWDEKVCISALRLRSLRMAVERDAVPRAVQAQVRLLSSLRTHLGARFALQLRGGAREAVGVELITLSSRTEGGAGSARRLAAELLTGLIPHRRWYDFEPVTAQDELRRIVDPFDIIEVAEVLRREAHFEPTLAPHGVGFVRGAPTPGPWALDLWPSSADSRRQLVELLLGSESELVVRVVIEPTRLLHQEHVGLARHDEELNSLPEGERARMARRSIDHLAALENAFVVGVFVGAGGPVARSTIEAIAGCISPEHPGPAGVDAAPGGYETIVSARDMAHDDRLVSAFRAFDPNGSGMSGAPASLERLRRIMDPWEAASAFRIPVATSPTAPGLIVDRTPVLAHASPAPVVGGGVRLGVIREVDQVRDAVLAPADRLRHVWVTGQTGTGKSSQIISMAVEDMHAGRGIAVIDPHGDLAEAVLERVPDGRERDVVLIDPADPVAVVGVNLLEPESEVVADYLVSDLCEFFQNLFDPQSQGIVGPRFQSWLRYGAQTLMAVPDAGTVCDLPRLFTDDDFMLKCFKHVSEPLTQDFWTNEMAKTDSHTRSEMLGWFNSKFEPFRTARLLRRVLGQPRSSVSFAEIIEERKILVVKLSKGLMGSYNTALMGYVVFAKLWGAAMGRAAIPAADRHPFYCYVDEFQSMLGAQRTSLPTMLSESRKFGIGLILVNQFLGQLPDEVRDALFGNVGSTLAFRLGSTDAALFAQASGTDALTAAHLQRLPNFVAAASLLAGGEPLEAMLLETTLPTRPSDADERAQHVRELSRAAWARPVPEVDEEWERSFR